MGWTYCGLIVGVIAPVVVVPICALATNGGMSVGGIVLNQDAKPIEGVAVTLMISTDDAERVAIKDGTVKTDAEGRWRCDIIPARLDKVRIRLQHPDYVAGGDTHDGTLESLRGMTNVMFMVKGIAVAGRVLDVDGRPIERATVSQGSDRSGAGYQSATTDGEGRFEFKHVRPDDAVLTVQAKGYSPDLKEIAVHRDPGPVEFRLERGRVLRGRIVDKAGNPIAGASVTPDAWRGNWSLEWRTNTDPSGRFRWDDTPADEVLFDMSKQGYMSVRGYGLTASNQEHTITMPPELHVKGQVVDQETGQPIPKFTVRPGLYWANNRPIVWDQQQLKTFVTAAYEVTFGEPCPAHLIQVEAEGYLSKVSRSFDDGEGEVAYDFTLKKCPVVTGTIRLPDGQPAVGANVVLCTLARFVSIRNGRIEQSPGSTSVQTGQDGRFSLTLQTERYSLVVLHDKGFTEVADEDPRWASDMTLTLWGRVEGRILIGRKPGVNDTVRVGVVRPGRRNAPLVQFDCNAVGDKDGHFMLECVPPGQMRIGLAGSGHGTPIEVKAGETTTVTIEGMGRPIIGRVIIPDAVKDHLDLQKLNLPVPPGELNGKPVLVCFFDMQQRLSRNTVAQLAKQAGQLKEKGITVLAVQASAMDEAALKAWVKDASVPLPIGTIQADDDKTRSIWAVKALPWLILTDPNHVVRAEGFAIDDLDKVCETIR